MSHCHCCTIAALWSTCIDCGADSTVVKCRLSFLRSAAWGYCRRRRLGVCFVLLFRVYFLLGSVNDLTSLSLCLRLSVFPSDCISVSLLPLSLSLSLSLSSSPSVSPSLFFLSLSLPLRLSLRLSSSFLSLSLFFVSLSFRVSPLSLSPSLFFVSLSL